MQQKIGRAGRQRPAGCADERDEQAQRLCPATVGQGAFVKLAGQALCLTCDDLEGILQRLAGQGELGVGGQGGPGGTLGGPMQALAWLAASAEAAAFGGLQAGQVVMLGSVALPVWLDRPGRIEVLFPPLAPVLLDLV